MKYQTERCPELELGMELLRDDDGAVYELDGDLQARIFADPVSHLSRIRALMKKDAEVAGICVPRELITDASGNFCGYVMKRPRGESLRSTVLDPMRFVTQFPSWTMLELTTVAMSIVRKVKFLNGKNVLVGNYDPASIYVAAPGEIFLAGTDRFQVDSFPCRGTADPDFLPPGGCSGELRSLDDESYALTVLLFMILMPGRRPFGEPGIPGQEDGSGERIFHYLLADEQTGSQPDPGETRDPSWFNLSYEIRQRFFRTFRENLRCSAEEWLQVLEEYALDLKSGNLSKEIFSIDPMVPSEDRTLNMNRRDISDTKENRKLRNIETRLTDADPPRKIAVIELSTKAVKLLIGNDQELIRRSPFDFGMFTRMGFKTNTGRGLNARNEMNMDYFRKNVLGIISSCVRTAQEKHVDRIYSVATAAYRTAANRAEILNVIRESTGLNVRILNKEEEARATLDAFSFSSRDKASLSNARYVMMIDQGGGSTEVSFFRNGETEKSYSINLGTEVLRTVLFRESSEQTSLTQSFRNVDNLIRDRLEAFYRNMPEIAKAGDSIYTIAVGSAITACTGKPSNALQHGTVLTVQDIKDRISELDRQLKAEFANSGELYQAAERQSGKKRNNNVDRMVVMRIGLPMFVILMTRLGIDKLVVSGTGLWYGIYFQHLFNLGENN